MLAEAGSQDLPGTNLRIRGRVVLERAPTIQEWTDMFDRLRADALMPPTSHRKIDEIYHWNAGNGLPVWYCR